MNPHQKNKIDINSLSPEEQRLFRLYGKLPSRSDHFAKHLKEQRKYFDSGDYAMSKAGKGDGVDTGTVGSQHPVPENIPHSAGVVPNGGLQLHPHHGQSMQAGSPVKESSFLHRETSADEVTGAAAAAAAAAGAAADPAGKKENAAAAAAPQQSEGIPIRR